MKKTIRLILGLLLLPFALHAQSLPKAEEYYAKGDFTAALKEYDTLLQTATGDDLLQAKLRKAACQYGLGEYLNAYKTMYGYTMPENEIWKARFLLYRIQMAKQVSGRYNALLNDGEIMTQEAQQDPEQWTQNQWNNQIEKDYQTLWALRAALVNAPVEKENLILNLENTDTQRIPTLFDFTVNSWTKYLSSRSGEVSPLAREERTYLDGAAVAEGKYGHAAQIAGILETAYLLDGKNRQNAKIFWKTDYILLPFHHAGFEIKNRQKAIQTAITQLNLLSGNETAPKSLWNKIKGYVAPAPDTAYARGYAALQTARLQFNNNQAPAALNTCETALSKLPKSAFTQECADLKRTITKVSFSINSSYEPLNRQTPQITLTGRNLHNLYVRVYKTSLKELTDLHKKTGYYRTLNSWNFLGRLNSENIPAFLSRTPIIKKSFSVPYQEVYKSQKTTLQLPALETGLYVAGVSYDESFDPAVAPVQMITLNATDLAFFSTAAIEGDPADYTAVLGAKEKQLRPNVFHLYTVNLKTGRPEGGTTLDMFTNWQGARQKAQTDEQGYAAFARAITVAPNAKNNPSYILNTLAEKDGSVAFSGNTLYFSFYNNDPVKLFAQTDRPVYRPSQKVRLSVNAFEVLPRGLKTLAGRKVTFTVKDPNYKTVFTASPVLNEFGTAQTEMTLPESDLLGRYEVTVSLSANGRTYREYLRFSTEEYKRPDYELTFGEPEKALEYGRTASVTGSAKYYFGAPLQNARVKYTVERQNYRPSFYWWLDWFGSQSQTVAQGESVTDAKGNFKVEFTPEQKTKNENFAQYIVKADVFDESGRAVSAEHSYKISAKPHLFRIEFTQGFYDANTSAPLAKITLTNADGHAVTGKITVEAVRLKNEIPAKESAQTQDGAEWDGEEPVYPDGNNSLDAIYQNAQTEGTVFRQDINFKTAGEQTLTLPALPEGVYRLQLSSAKASPQKMVFIVAEENSALILPEVALAQQKQYFCGETMRVLIGAGELPESKRVEVYRNGGNFLYKKDLLAGGVSIYSLPVTDQLRGGVSLAWFGAGNYRFFSNSTTVSVPFDNKELAVTFTPPQTVRPAEPVSWTLTAKNADGTPVNGQANITVYDKSLDYYVKNQPSLTFTNLYPQRTGTADSNRSAFYAQTATLNKVKTEIQDIVLPLELPALNLNMMRRLYSRMYNARFASIDGAMPMMANAKMAAKQEAAFDTAAEAEADLSLNESATATSRSMDYGEEYGAAVTAGGAAAGAEDAAVQPRTDFSETAYFNPQLPVTNGQAAVKFTMPQSLTTWNMFGFVLTQTAGFGPFTAQTVTKKDFMVRLQTPRFYREGDKGVIQAALTNLTDKKLSAQVTLSVQKDGQNALAAFGLARTAKTVTVAGNSTQFVTWEVTAPAAPALYTLTAAARAGKSADAEQKTLPVLPAKMRLLATVNKALKNGQNTLTLSELEDADIQDVETVALTLNPSLALSVINSMPNLLSAPYNDLVSTLNRFVPLAVVNKFYTTYPQLKEAVKKLPKRDGQTPAWNENDPLRLTLLEQTPWLRQAQGNKQHAADVIDLFNAKTVQDTLAKETKKIAKFQNKSGAFTWFAGGPDDDYLTLYTLSSFAQALQYKADIPQDQAKKAFAYILPRIEKYLKEDKTGSAATVSYALYAAYTLSAFPPQWAQMSQAKPYIKRWVDYADQQARFMTPLGQIYAAAVYHRLGDDVKAARYLDLVTGQMKQNELSGAYFAPEPQSWIWYNDTLATQTVTLKTLLEMRPDSDKIDPMVQWLLFNRQVTGWNDSKAAAAAVFTLLDVMKAKGALSQAAVYQTDWAGGQKTLTFEPFDWTEDLQLVRTKPAVSKSALTARVTKQTPMTDFASLSAVYQASDAKASPKGVINVSREYYLRKKQGDEVQLRPLKDLDSVAVGDEIDVRLTLTTDSAFEYVHLQDPKPAGFESEDLLSGWEWENIRFYRENRDAATNFFINRLPNGTVTLHYILRPTVAGKFHTLPAQAQSMYAPEFGAHSASETLSVSK